MPIFFAPSTQTSTAGYSFSFQSSLSLLFYLFWKDWAFSEKYLMKRFLGIIPRLALRVRRPGFFLDAALPEIPPAPLY
jgi:hypothetical protein